ncbi:MAG: glycosyltransferase family 4 protein [Nitrospirae bacterium]|nr:glycosyltransferase family 4 protein [Nitrospirota bacterium]
MNILILAEVSAATVIGGAERVLREQALGLQQRGHQVDLVVRAPLEDPRLQVAVGAVTEHRYGVLRQNQCAFVLSSFLRSVQTFDCVCARDRQDIVLVHQSMAALGPILIRRALARGWVYVCHSLAHEEYLSRTGEHSALCGRVARALGAWLRRWCERVVMQRCAKVVVLSAFMKQRVMAAHRIDESKIHILPGGADPVKFRPAGDRAEVRRSLGIPTDKVVLLAVRNLVARMGLDRLIQAMVQVEKEHPDVLLLIGGSGPLHQELERLIADLHLTHRVKLLGFIAEEELPHYYQAADVVLMPTHELEGFGLVTVEALACGTPVLGTPVGAIPEVLARLGPGLLAKGSDPDSLALAIDVILSRFRAQPDEWERLSLKGRTLVMEHYNWSRHNEQLDLLLQDVCGHSSMPSRGW